jgi:hypothetical protein
MRFTAIALAVLACAATAFAQLAPTPFTKGFINTVSNQAGAQAYLGTPTTATNLSGAALAQVTNIVTSLIPVTATNISGAALVQVTNTATAVSTVIASNTAASQISSNNQVLLNGGINQFLLGTNGAVPGQALTFNGTSWTNQEPGIYNSVAYLSLTNGSPTNCPVDFSQFYRIEFTFAASLTNQINFYLTNWGATPYLESRQLVLRGVNLASSQAIDWLTAMSWQSESGLALAPTNVWPQRELTLSFKSSPQGLATVSQQWGPDPQYVTLDPYTTAYFGLSPGDQFQLPLSGSGYSPIGYGQNGGSNTIAAVTNLIWRLSSTNPIVGGTALSVTNLIGWNGGPSTGGAYSTTNVVNGVTNISYGQLDALYPYMGGSLPPYMDYGTAVTNGHQSFLVRRVPTDRVGIDSRNLLSTNYYITWYGALTNAAQHNFYGVSNYTASSYGSNGYVPSVLGRTNQMVASWNYNFSTPSYSLESLTTSSNGTLMAVTSPTNVLVGVNQSSADQQSYALPVSVSSLSAQYQVANRLNGQVFYKMPGVFTNTYTAGTTNLSTNSFLLDLN